MTKREKCPYLKTFNSPLTTILVDLQRGETVEPSLGRHGDKTVQEWIVTKVSTQHVELKSTTQRLLTNSLQCSWVQAMRETCQQNRVKE